MKVKELLEKLQTMNPEANISVITLGNRNEPGYTSEPKVTSHKNMFGETVWIQ